MSSETFSCKVRNAPVSAGEAIVRLAPSGLFEGPMRDALVTICSSALTLSCKDMYSKGGTKTLLNTPLSAIDRVTTQPLSSDRRMKSNLKKTLLLGMGLSTIIFVVIALRVGWETLINPPPGGNPFAGILIAIAGGFILSFLFYFVPNFLKNREPLTQFTLHLSDKRACFFFVAREKENDTKNILESIGLSVASAQF